MNSLNLKKISNFCFFSFFLRNAVAAAFNYWSEHTPLTFQEVCSTCKSDLTIDFAYKDHRDGFPFDGPGGVLAHAFFPEVRSQYSEILEWKVSFYTVTIALPRHP